MTVLLLLFAVFATYFQVLILLMHRLHFIKGSYYSRLNQRFVTLHDKWK